MIKEDSVSLGLSLGAVMIPIYLATFIGFHTLLLIPTFMLLTGITFQMWISRKIEHDESLSVLETKDMILYTLIALAGIGIGSIVAPGLFKPPALPALETTSMQIQGPLLYGALYAISEERFFRGAWTLFLDWKLDNPILTNVGSGGMFMVYHFAVYGTSPDKLTYVFIAGTILSFVVLRSGRLTPALLGHIFNNVMV